MGASFFPTLEAWFKEARAADPEYWNAMHLATVSADGRPSGRVVLLKGFDASGFVFYTNLGSRKARELLARPFASLTFHWPALERQVRIEGRATQVPDAEADAYFASRPRGSQIGAWASRQSEPLDSRKTLLTRVAGLEARFERKDVTRPPFWSGFRIEPDLVELWSGKPDRLHERLVWRRGPDGWVQQTLYP